MSQQRKFFPGWLVVASGFVIMATCYTIFVNCMSLFQPLIVSDLGITLAQYNISNAISTVVSVIGSLVIGHVADKVSGRVLGSLTVIATSAVLAGMSFVGELWQVYVLFAVSGCFAVASTRLLISLVTANWFTAKRGLAISIALSGSGFGGAILSPIVSSLIVSVGWRSAFLVLAAICMVAALPITAYSFRTKPSEIGLSRSVRTRAIRPSRRLATRTSTRRPRLTSVGRASRRVRRFGCLSSPSSLWASSTAPSCPTKLRT